MTWNVPAGITVGGRREDTMRERRRPQASGGEGGFALVLAILALMLLTMLGLTLATTTSTELQVATNYRWNQQAYYNAEAGVEMAKAILRTADWNAILPAPRTATPWDGKTTTTTAGGGAVAPYSRADAWGNPTRNWENASCDARGFGMGYGVVLDDGSASAPYQYVTTAVGQTLNGAFTVWIRRPIKYNPNTSLIDYNTDNDNMVLVSEGIAPYTGGNIATTFGVSNRAVQVIEVALSRATTLASGGCGSRGGQAGGGPMGAGFGGCDPLGGGAAITGALAGGATGTGGELNPTQ